MYVIEEFSELVFNLNEVDSWDSEDWKFRKVIIIRAILGR
jgi:hypothetical protein